MVTQLNSAKRGIATEEMKQVARDEEVDINFILKNVANGSIIIPKNIARKQNIKPTGIGHGLRTKVNVNIGTSTLYQNIDEVSKAKIAVKHGANTLMDLSDGGNLDSIRETLLNVSSPLTFGSVPIYQAYGLGVEKYKNPLNITEDDFLNAFEKHAKDGVDYTTIHSGITLELAEYYERQKTCRYSIKGRHNNRGMDVKI